MNEVNSIQRIVRRCRVFWRELTGDDPTMRLALVSTFALCWGGLGIAGILLSLLGMLLKPIAPPEHPINGIGNLFAISFMRAVVGYSCATIIDAIWKLLERDKPNSPNEEAERP